jgi:hypothetical protein
LEVVVLVVLSEVEDSMLRELWFLGVPCNE